MGINILLITMIGALALSIVSGFTSWACISSLLVLPPMRRPIVVSLLVILVILIVAVAAMSLLML